MRLTFLSRECSIMSPTGRDLPVCIPRLRQLLRMCLSSIVVFGRPYDSTRLYHSDDTAFHSPCNANHSPIRDEVISLRASTFGAAILLEGNQLFAPLTVTSKKREDCY